MITNKRFGRKDDLTDVHRGKAPGQYALELDASLRRLSSMHNQTRYLMGLTLSILRDKSAFMRLGYASLASFSAQELGMQAGQSLEIARMAKELRHRPTTLFRHLSGQISFAALRHVFTSTPRFLEAETSDYFVGLTVGEAEDMAAEFVLRYEEACADVAARRGDDEKPRPKKRKKRTSKKPVDPRVGELARRLAEGGHRARGGGAFESSESEEGRWVELDASPGLAARFFVGVELARCLEGADARSPLLRALGGRDDERTGRRCAPGRAAGQPGHLSSAVTGAGRRRHG